MPARRIFGLWLMTLVPLLIAVDGPPVQRTQEARVLETARQMIGHGAHAWLIPSINGETRLRKPPLAYWMAAASFKLFGVSESSGRLPTVLLSWLLIGAVYAIAARVFDRAVGIFAAAALLSSYLFFRYGRLAETDAPAVLFATVATDLFWRAIDGESAGLFHAAAAMTGLSFFAKQGPGFFPLLFFVAWSIVRKKTGAIRRFLVCGAPITLLALAGWWYVYAAADQGMAQFRRELAEVAEGIDHPATFLIYFPWIMLAVAPWSLPAAGALVAAIRRAGGDARLLGMLVWAAADFVPLCFLGNKQEHYLLPLMPPLMILLGWLLSRALSRDEDPKLKRAVLTLMGLTIIASIVAPIGVPIAGGARPANLFVALAIITASIWTWRVFKRRGLAASAMVFAVVWAFSLPLLLDVWGPTIMASDVRVTAAAIKNRFGDGPYIFYGQNNSLPLCFAMRRRIDHISDARPDRLVAAALAMPGLVVICQVEGPPTKLPAGFEQVGPDVGAAGQRFRIYQLMWIDFW
jgi:4-amino-4-deoxy-L-arabinose transferase-like glycosyltransferase